MNFCLLNYNCITGHGSIKKAIKESKSCNHCKLYKYDKEGEYYNEQSQFLDLVFPSEEYDDEDCNIFVMTEEELADVFNVLCDGNYVFVLK